ncbi:Stk1 family PASTA domain-containing Ser/Thr kinase [Streptococcaceae bacterium ESL0729]|nr:Stk1 family PASTA domain-containing Ser/Thr kinase [Streptococcaceae bacterium ESL0729]
MIQVGKLFAERYLVMKEIGRGGMANVYLAEDTFLDNRLVAIKVLRSNLENDSIAIARFQREAYAMSELNHPNIVGISDVGDVDNQQYIVMEYIDGVTLKQYIKEHAPLSNDEAIHYISQILSAMKLAHERGIIHRDLKPQNILISKSGDAKVTDFGIAMAFAETSLTQTNSMFGSIHYLSPEQARGAKATVQSDIYAMGIILYEMLTGDVPFDGDSAVTIALQHFQKPLPSIININKNVPQALENVVIKATAKDLSDRYQNVSEMLKDVATSTSLDRKDEKKLVFTKDKEDENETKVLPKMVLDKSDTEELVKKVSTDTNKIKEEEEAKPNSRAKGKKKTGWIIGSVAAAILALIIALVIFTTPKDIKIPQVSGMTIDQAKEAISKSGLKVGNVKEEPSDTYDKDQVIRTNPAIGTTKKEGSSIDLYVSLGKGVIEMPDYVSKGFTYEDAVADLVRLGISELRIIKTSVTSDKDEDVIIGQNPSKGGYLDKNSSDPITLEVSNGGKTGSMSSLVGLSVSEAKKRLKNMGVSENNISLVENKTINPNDSSNPVTDQSIDVGTPFNPKKVKIELHYNSYDAQAAAEAEKKAQEEAAKKELETAKESAKTTINGLSNLSDVEKNNFISSVDKATTTKDVESAVSDAKSKDDEYKKKDDDAKLASAKEAAKVVIDGLNNLPASEKSAFKELIKKASSIDSINSIVSDAQAANAKANTPTGSGTNTNN